MAQRIHPSEKANVYNIAMIMQKAAEMIFTISPAKRTLEDLMKAVQQAVEAQKYVYMIIVENGTLSRRLL